VEKGKKGKGGNREVKNRGVLEEQPFGKLENALQKRNPKEDTPIGRLREMTSEGRKSVSKGSKKE